MEEKRKDKRIKEDFSILCKAYRKIEFEGLVSRIIDLSLRGLAFFTNIRLQKGDIVEISFRIPPDFKERVEVFGCVLESRMESDTEFRVRVAFIDMDTTTKTALGRLIEQAGFKTPLRR